MTKKILGNYGHNGCISVTWLPVNQAYLVMWHDQPLRIFNTRYETVEYLQSIEVAV